jgi:hypothetical protein
MRIGILDTSLTQSFGNIFLVDVQSGSSPIRFHMNPATWSYLGSHNNVGMTDARHPVYDFSPYGIPFSVQVNVLAHSKSAGSISIFFIERDMTDVELG